MQDSLPCPLKKNRLFVIFIGLLYLFIYLFIYLFNFLMFCELDNVDVLFKVGWPAESSSANRGLCILICIE